MILAGALGRKRVNYQRIQLRAAIRRAPETALQAIKDLGLVNLPPHR